MHIKLTPLLKSGVTPERVGTVGTWIKIDGGHVAECKIDKGEI